MDALGNLLEDQKTTTLISEDAISFTVRCPDTVRYWILNGFRIELPTQVNEFVLRDVNENLTVSAVSAVTGGTTAPVVSENMVQITCENCVFTYAAGGLNSVTSGSVPEGATIIVISDINGAPGGYSINGGAFERQGKVSFRLKVLADTAIIAQ